MWQIKPGSDLCSRLVIMRAVVTRGWRTAATALGLLFLVSCVVLVGILTV